MITVFHAVLCADVITDSRTGQVSYIKVIETVTAPSLPITVRGASLGLLCRSSTLTPNMVRLDVIAPDNSSVNIMMFTAELTNAPYKILINIDQMLFATEGPHALLISCKEANVWKSVASIPINVVYQQQ